MKNGIESASSKKNGIESGEPKNIFKNTIKRITTLNGTSSASLVVSFMSSVRSYVPSLPVRSGSSQYSSKSPSSSHFHQKDPVINHVEEERNLIRAEMQKVRQKAMLEINQLRQQERQLCEKRDAELARLDDQMKKLDLGSAKYSKT